MDTMKTVGIIIGILGFLFLITIHEAGHFTVAKLLGIKVNEFSVGMGPLLFSKEKGGTLYSFRAFPIGGYCALEGENDESDDPSAFVNSPGWKQFLILIAGSLINFVAGFLIFVIVYSIVAAGQVGFDRVLQISLSDCTMMVSETLKYLFGFFKGTSSPDDVSGVVGIVAIIADTAGYGLLNVFYLVGIISVNLSFMNMLPIPGLDGGRILVMLIKKISGGRLSQKAENIINGVGFILILALMVLLIFKDTLGLIRG